MATSEFATRLLKLIDEASQDDLAAFADALRSGTVTLHSKAVDLEYVLSGSREILQGFVLLLRSWHDGGHGSPVGLAGAIEACSISADRARQLPRAELVWTGPQSGHPTARRTFQVMNEMLKRPTEQVLIVGYSLFLKGDLARDFIEKLSRISSSGVDVSFVVDRRYAGWGPHGAEGHSVREIFETWPKGMRRPSVHSWKSDEDEGAKLHAKLLLVDDRDLLVTSANLTGGGLDTNLELGVRIQGEVARNCGEHFRKLKAAGFFNAEVWPE